VRMRPVDSTRLSSNMETLLTELRAQSTEHRAQGSEHWLSGFHCGESEVGDTASEKRVS